MSREIKFRAWLKPRWDDDEDAGEMYYDVQNSYDTLGDVKPYDIMDSFDQWLDDGVAIVEQYTGLKDKNGREIYEGDIIESTWNGDKAEVVWNDVEGEWEHYADFNTHSKYSGSVVIGNIHENPELIRGEE